MSGKPNERSSGPTNANTGRFYLWLTASVLGVTVLTLVCVQAPSRIKLLGLFAVGYGLLAGLWIGRLLRETRVDCVKTAAVLAVVIVAVGMVGMAVESHRLYAAAIARQYAIDPNTLLAGKTAIVGGLESPAHFEKIFQESRQQRLEMLAEMTSFSAYLRNRTAGPHTSAMGWPHPWPWALFVGEVLLASVAGAWFIFREVAHLIDEKESVR